MAVQPAVKPDAAAKALSILITTARLGILSVLLGLLLAFMLFAGYSRYLADDYCEASHVSDRSGLQYVLTRYTSGTLRNAGRFSSPLLISLVETAAPGNVPALPLVMIGLWLAGVTWLVRELRLAAFLSWSLVEDALLGSALAFFAMLQAPDPFQTFYWRSGMVTHFAPVVLLVLLLAQMVRHVRRRRDRGASLWMGLWTLLASFLISGFSEPPVATMVTGGVLALAMIWLWHHGPARRAALELAACLTAGSGLALGVMFMAPAIQAREGAPALGVLVQRVVTYPPGFMLDTFKSLPIPTALTVLLPALIFFILVMDRPGFSLGGLDPRHRRILAALIPFVLYLLIAANFAPSAYGQSYPIARARFMARCLMTAALMLEGLLLGSAVAELGLFASRRRLSLTLAALALVAFFPYLLRAGMAFGRAELGPMREHARAWDARNAQILADRTAGQTDLVVANLPDLGGISELRDDPNHYINRCAAQYYGVHSISAPRQDP